MRKEIKYLAFLLIPLLLLSSCWKEPWDPTAYLIPEEPGSWIPVHFRATVSQGAETKATLDEHDIHYVFERDDLLYVVDKDSYEIDNATASNNANKPKLYGLMYLVSGAGATTAVFEGDLMYFVAASHASSGHDPSVYEPGVPDPDYEIVATLVSAAQRDDDIFTSSNGKIVYDEDSGTHKLKIGPRYGNSAVTDSFKAAVQKYSHFTAGATFGNPVFSLRQNSAFVIFQLSFADEVVDNTMVTITMSDNSGDLCSKEVPAAENQAGYVAAFKGGTQLGEGAKVTATYTLSGTPTTKEKSLKSTRLLANWYYHVTKTFVPLKYFTIQATSATTINFNYTSNLEYRVVGGVSWTPLTSSVSLADSQGIELRGTNTAYNTGTLFSSPGAPCHIYGDIMSLFCDSFNGNTENRTSTLGANALKETFQGLSNIDIPSGRPVLLSATSLGEGCYTRMFSGSSITRAPEFFDEEEHFAVTIPASACSEMFSGCTALKSAPNLPATKVEASGYYRMFAGCTALETASFTLASAGDDKVGVAACREMFSGCTHLLYGPTLPATSIPENGYYQMFSGCSSLVEASNLPVTTIGVRACFEMFKDCASLVKGPDELPATGTQLACYASMFSGCSNLEAAPEIGASGTLAESCFDNMFSDCSMLRQTRNSAFDFTVIGLKSCYRMFYNCASLNDAPNMPSVTNVGESGCEEMYASCGELRTTPTQVTADASSNPVIGKAGFHMMFAQCRAMKTAPNIYAKEIAVDGCREMFQDCIRLETPPTSLPATNIGKSAYQSMFERCSSLKSAPTFPSVKVTLVEKYNCYMMFKDCISLTTVSGRLFSADTQLRSDCCNQMFYGCSSLKSIPSDYLPSQKYAANCYLSMFEGSAITEAPTLALSPDVQLSSSCFNAMFRNCTSLKTVPANYLPSKKLASSCYRNMFTNTAITEAPAMGVDANTELKSTCFREMFSNCASLTTIPANYLPSKKLADYCYYGMFIGTAIGTAPDLAVEDPSNPVQLTKECFRQMFQNCTSLTNVPADYLPYTALANSCYRGMFQNTGITTAPDLLVTTLPASADYCYQYMFAECRNLNSVRCMATNPDGTKYSNNWMKDISVTNGTFYCDPAAVASWPSGVHGIPSGWTVNP